MESSAAVLLFLPTLLALDLPIHRRRPASVAFSSSSIDAHEDTEQRHIPSSIARAALRTTAAQVRSGAMPPTRSKRSSFLPPKLHRWLSEPANPSMSPTSAAKASKAGIALRAIPGSDRPSKMQPPSKNEPSQGTASPSTPSHTTPVRVATRKAIGVYRPSCLYLDQWPSQRGIASSVDVVCYPREDSNIRRVAFPRRAAR